MVLAAAIEHLYCVFQGNRRPPHTDGCPHCVGKHDTRGFFEKPLRQLTPADLRTLIGSLGLTWGGAPELRYLLPRLTELLVDMEYDIEICLGTLRHCEWRTWPAAEQAAVEAYADALWRHTLSHYPADVPAEDILCALGQFLDDLSPQLDAWETAPGPAPLRHLAQVVADNGKLASGKLGNAFWSDRFEPMRQVVNWLLRPAVHDRLWVAFADGEAEIVDEVTRAIERLEMSRAFHR